MLFVTLRLFRQYLMSTQEAFELSNWLSSSCSNFNRYFKCLTCAFDKSIFIIFSFFINYSIYITDTITYYNYYFK